MKEKEPDIKVISKACPMLATIAEEGRATGVEGKKAIKEYMQPFKENGIDKIILGCTHFPIYEQLIKDEFKYKIELINTGKTVSIYLKKLLKERGLCSDIKKGRIEINLTKEEKNFSKIAQNILLCR